MMFRCNQDHRPASTGFLGLGAKPRRKIEGITAGKTYEGVIFPIVKGEGNIGFGSIETEANLLIYNDYEKWEYYQLDLFSPA
jgi:hypothetical protein